MNLFRHKTLLMLSLTIGSLFIAASAEADYPWDWGPPAKDKPATGSPTDTADDLVWEEQILMAERLLNVPPRNKYPDPSHIAGDPWEDGRGPENRPGKPN